MNKQPPKEIQFMINRRATAAATGVGAALLLALTACSSGTETTAADTSVNPAPAMSDSPTDSMSKSSAGKKMPQQDRAVPGSFISYADYQADTEKYAMGDVVLFFNATWCPTCQEANGNLESASIPEGLTVVSVDYDTSTDLKQKYGITTQHTFVQVDPDGKELTKFTGSTTIDEINGQLV